MKSWNKCWKAGVAAWIAVTLFSGCGISEAISTGGGEKEYGKAETMMILSTEKARYEELYTEAIWAAAVDHRGTDFEAVLLDQVHDFLRELKFMSQMADEKGIALTGREKELVKEAAADYYEELGSDNAEAFGLDKQMAEDLYLDYWKAEKLVEQLTGGMDLEVSDSEAKVIEVAQIVMEDRALAEEVYGALNAENADFYAVAKAYREEGATKVQLHYGMMGDAYEKAAYELAENEISSIVEESGKYYILKCIDDYNEEATKIRKEEMVQQKKNEAFHSNYQAYKADKTLIEDSELWANLSMDMISDTEADFFAIFDAVCLEQGSE